MKAPPPLPLPLPWQRSSPLTQALYRLRMRGAFYSWTEAHGDAAVDMPCLPDALSFHIVARGMAWLEVAGQEPLPLPAGWLALVPRGLGQRLCTRPGAPLLGRADLLPQQMLGDLFSRLCLGHGEGEAPLALLCGVLAFDSAVVHDMLAVLPPVIVIDSARHPVMAALLPLLMRELHEARPGSEAVATRLADVLVVETVRAWLADEPQAAGGWLAALRDPQLGAALAAVHEAPGRGWTVAQLAQQAAMSRSAFAARFSAVVGVAPMAYVAKARMRAARAQLAEGASVSAVAEQQGYGSEAAFSRAFARLTGETPGQVRRAARFSGGSGVSR